MQHPPIQLRSDSFTFTPEIALFCHFLIKTDKKSLKFRHFSDFLDLVFYLRGPTMTMELISITAYICAMLVYRSLRVLNMPDYRSSICEILRSYRSFIIFVP